MRLRLLLPALLLAGTAACDGLLDADPVDQLPVDQAITSAEGARTALAGAYNALQSASYYGGDFVFFGDLSADNAVHTGTFQTFDDADVNQLRADNGTVEGIWDALYIGLNRANVLLRQVPGVTDLDADERDQILGEAHFLRALHLHNLVKLWGDVPMPLEPAASVDEAGRITRTPADQVYAQIVSDLQQAASLMSEEQTRQASAGAARALLARVQLYRGQWAAALAQAEAVEAMGYTLAPSFGDLFDEDGADTDEDILRVTFTASDYNNLGYYYLSEDEGGRGEVAPQQELIDAYEADDARLAWSISGDEEGDAFGTRFPSTAGAEDVHVIRFAEVVLTRAEALARLGRLEEAVDQYNRIRERAGVDPHVLGVDVTGQQQVLQAIWAERQRELAFEGDRWPDLVRTGRAAAVLGIPAFQTLYPVPQGEIDVASGLTQNPGY
ncbi:RagB/SusD family nutrient uptake outer membrane protein [Longimicrobium sp.]|uniref:RagB/SusD family nutrient uptake outer membrane protein n=1 Tax=Longimicrobium sp. TaxID=2029185 RepID=UPI002E3384D8|nr:RagB/SusD family nutrient uptake outer membrane protein [Longimicrobium sp.]HEX6040029.1 RagB/SusD family nutrient uptake outer membrane protein [Longimicrobium sp.]